MTDSRRKGRAGEQELARLLRDELELEVRRNWQAQAAQGGQDLVGLAGYAIECKRYAVASYADLERWWQQAVKQARTHETPVLAYRVDRAPWRFIIPGDHRRTFALAHEVSLCGFLALVRRRRQPRAPVAEQRA